MYKQYFGFKSLPFSIAPDPRYLYMSERHREALAHLLFGIKSEGGFVLLTGEVGTGKTTICRCLLEQAPQKTVIAFILNPKLTVQELLATICEEFGFKYPKDNASNKVKFSALRTMPQRCSIVPSPLMAGWRHELHVVASQFARLRTPAY